MAAAAESAELDLSAKEGQRKSFQRPEESVLNK